MSYVVIIDKSAGNESVGEMWQETKIFPNDATLDDVMNWALKLYGGSGRTYQEEYSHSRITLTRPHPAPEQEVET